VALMHVNFISGQLGMCVSADVILPQAPAGSPRGGKHPVLWLLHGFSDDQTIWQRRTAIERYAAPLGLAVVMPCAHLSSYTDMAHGGKYFSYIADELPVIMRSFFPLSERREDNFIAGLSMGGAGSMKIGLARPEQYAAIGCLSAGLSMYRSLYLTGDPAHERQEYLVHGGRDITGTVEDDISRARRIVAEGLPAPRIYHAWGTEDFVLESARRTREFFTGFEGNPFGYTPDEGPGAHTWEFWEEHIQTFLRFLGLPSQEEQ
jgi:putative tributyrin esterase